MIRFTLKTEYIELYKLLKVTGLCDSGGQAKHVIEENLVKVDGQPETRKTCKIRPGQRIDYQGQTLVVQGLEPDSPIPQNRSFTC